MNKKGKINLPLITTVGPVSTWMILLVAIPFLYVFIMAFMYKDPSGGVKLGFTLENFKQVFDPLYLKIFGESIFISLFTTIVCIVIAYPFTYFIAQKTTIKKTVFMAMVIVPFLVSSLIRLFGWINILRKDGILNSLLIKLGLTQQPLELVYNTTGVMIGLVYMLLPFMILPLYSSIEKLDKSLLEACSDLGAKPAKAFLKVTLPLTMPGIFAGSILVFIPALGYFFVTDILGGSKTQVIGNIIRNQFITARNWPLGSAISIFLIVITLILVWLYQKSGGSMDDLGGI
ncbi:spermidine/putrescine transport system permease protein [Clostridium saccharoperbutylacetonicum]|uniref:Spermidine/putrescine transport system permease protein PotB n=1 Tax=Clostridium saccharoperbutylacetonicum N1-4(HMT) TaxID=931276 RepID=M1MK29_9CLOT|nr:ABC transporter permease [Clostridium saccharoperbutylacetonicum]AGF56658.1 spermidine/putrescine transport system permease protein PotB [Clostridium saccharoperbutylacetonicum N1-4(HMT)]NRT62588.1 spermidine/putrescine transport system permease protein [Clostridium saccharoperbutylacetonicum]NSB25936.1 spermidine/putrescine transport system permease protein [Clostridium saccharoperbutylacetonicum]NSB45294.1 spermidine/putrescine transport system permease protein [Clostridium saccharoperbuty